MRTLEAWLQASGCRFGPVFRKVNRWSDVEPQSLHPDAVRQILRRRATQAGLTVSGLERLSPHGLRANFITEAYRQGARDEMRANGPRQHQCARMRVVETCKEGRPR